MEKIIIVLMIALFVLVLAIQLGIAYGIFWILVKFGAPKYIAIMCALSYFIVSGLVASLKNNK